MINHGLWIDIGHHTFVPCCFETGVLYINILPGGCKLVTAVFFCGVAFTAGLCLLDLCCCQHNMQVQTDFNVLDSPLFT